MQQVRRSPETLTPLLAIAKDTTGDLMVVLGSNCMRSGHALAPKLLPDLVSRRYPADLLVPSKALVQQNTDETCVVEVDCGGDSKAGMRAALMVRNNEGLTKTYNRFHDPQERSPDIQTLHDLHARTDAAVLAAYGWTDLPTACDFILDYEEDEAEERTGRKREKPWRYRWPDDTRDEVLARLLKLNGERAREEQLAGVAAAAAAPPKRRKGGTGRRGADAAPAQGKLLPPPQQDVFC